MITTVLSAILLGTVIGALARLILPGRQSISLLVTVILGILGSMVGSWVVYQVGYENTSEGFEVVPFLAGVLAAAVLIVVYGMLTGRKQI